MVSYAPRIVYEILTLLVAKGAKLANSTCTLGNIEIHTENFSAQMAEIEKHSQPRSEDVIAGPSGVAEPKLLDEAVASSIAAAGRPVDSPELGESRTSPAKVAHRSPGSAINMPVRCAGCKKAQVVRNPSGTNVLCFQCKAQKDVPQQPVWDGADDDRSL